MTSPAINSSGQFGSSEITVNPSVGAAAFTTLTNANAYAATLGGGTIIVFPGTYNESVTWTANLTVIGSSTGTVTATSGLSTSPVIINGNQTYTGTGYLAFQNVAFTSSSGTAWSSTLPAASSLSFSNSSIVNSGGAAIAISGANSATSVLNLNTVLVNGSTTGITATSNLLAYANACRIVADNDSVTLGTSVSFFSNDNTYVSLLSNCIALTASSSSYSSSLSSYFAPSGSGIEFSAAATAKSFYEQYDSDASDGYYADTSSSSGTFEYAFISLTGSAVSINPSIDAIAVPVQGSGVIWSDVSASSTVAVNTGTFATAAIILTLPSAPSQGDICQFVIDTASGVTITANTGQFIRIGNDISVSAGTAVSSAQGDALALVYRASDLTWFSQQTQGNWLVT